MNVLEDIEFKILLDELIYLRKSLDNKKEMNIIIDKLFKKEVDKYKKEVDSISKSESKSNISINLEDKSTKKQDVEIDTGIKKLYKDVVKITHPDKNNNKESEQHLKITEAYKKNDIVSMLEIANDLNIKIDYKKIDIEKLKFESDRMKAIIAFFEHSIPWKWYRTNQTYKEEFILNYIS